MNEHGFIRSIHNYLNPSIYKWKIHDTYTGGVPDCMYAGPAGVLFVEYKYVDKLPKRVNTMIRHSLSPLQCAWLERMQQSTPVALILGVKDTALIISSDFSTNISKMTYIEESVSRQEVAKWIYNLTHDGVTYEKFRADTTGCVKSAQNLATKESRNAIYPD